MEVAVLMGGGGGDRFSYLTLTEIFKGLSRE